jgi:Pvc16 N-terminal domain
MSNYLAIATVTATLKDILQTAAAKDVTDHEVIVMTVRPDLAKNEAQDAKATINIYLYQVTPNAALRNSDLPTRRADGTILNRPQVALDLHYMISFYGAENQFVTQRLLGSAVRTLHAEPQLSREKIRRTIIAQPILSDSNLADQFELVKFTPLHLSLEELAKIWSVFYQIPYVLSVAYQGTVVLIESDDTPQNALSVQVRNIYAVPFNQPNIEQVGVKATINQTIVPGRPITVNDVMRILGKNLRGTTGTLIQFNGVEVVPDSANVSDRQIDLPLNAPLTLSDGTKVSPANVLRAGVQGVQVIQRMQMGMDKVNDQQNWHRGVESNVAAFVLRPMLSNPITNVAGEVTVTLTPVVSRKQRVVLLLNEVLPQPAQQPALPQRARTYSFTADPKAQSWKDQTGAVVTDPAKFSGEDTTDTIKFSIPGIVPGPVTYLIRVQVDGAESLLDLDTNPQSPTFNMYSGTPKVTI